MYEELKKQLHYISREEMIAWIRKNNAYYLLVNFACLSTHEIKKIYSGLKKHKKEARAYATAV